MQTPIPHTLPTDTDPGDTSWFTDRQNSFEQQEVLRQTAFRRSQWPDLPPLASHRGGRHFYPHILPPGNERRAYYEGFADEAMNYMRDSDIQTHTEVLNLKSSQAACVNFLFPLRMDSDLAVRALENILPDVAAVKNIEFEYTGQDETNRADQPCTAWLGEPASGKRGQNRTSIDAAIFWTDTRNASRITLLEWKYTERNFGSCSAYDKAKPETKERCRRLDPRKSPGNDCILAGNGRHCSRRYWEHLSAAGISAEKLSAVTGCPFRGPFYQLMRQFLVAQFLRKHAGTGATDAADIVDVVAIEFEGNHALRAVPPHLSPLCAEPEDTVVDAWNFVLDAVPPLRRISAEHLMAGYDAADPGPDPSWRTYIHVRYGL